MTGSSAARQYLPLVIALILACAPISDARADGGAGADAGAAAAVAATLAESDYSDDDGPAELQDQPTVIFGRALDLQGNPLRQRSAVWHKAAGGLFAPGLHSGPFVRPAGLPVRTNAISSSFGTRWHPLLGGYRFHAGIDLAAAMGSPVFATSSGTVAASGWCGGYGICVTIDHGDGCFTLYGHLSRVDVAPGMRVSSGQALGLVGSTGNSTGPHLHYEVRINGRPVDPVPYLRGAAR